MAYISFDPWRLRVTATYPEISDTVLDEALEEADRAYRLWRNAGVAERCEPLPLMRDYLMARREELAVLMAGEIGKPVAQGLAETDKCAFLCDYYAEKAESMLQPERRGSSARESHVFYEPQGIILGIMPWNFPLWQVFRFMVPALTGGNAVLLKHASNVPGCALAIEEIVKSSGYPAGLFRTLFTKYEQVNTLIADTRVRGVSLTGSNSVGGQIAAVAGHNLKKVVMELGGSDPFIIFPDAALDQAVEAAVFARFQNGGQSCIAAKRIFIHNDIYDDFKNRFIKRTLALRTGDPLNPDTEIGPLVSIDAATELERQLSETIRAGARLLCGGRGTFDNPALFFPAVVEDVPLSSPLAREEVFGPVAPLFRFKSAAEAIKMANETPFGLGATVWTTNEILAMNVAREIDSGMVAINGFVKSEPGLPFGGVKESGFGRELATEGLHEFLNIKTINIF
jgi:succinate-semialdehyde dehydrogenase/glutarate-semialdehyde dehydrogenase